jgi:dTDP-4-dehydrorhamnose 3,5-epimerase
MILRETPLAGAYVVELEPLADERGHFARTFDAELFAERGLDARVAQCSTSFNERAGTLRGMHYQADPHGEAKLVRVTRGAVYDVIVDLRDGSPTRCRWFAIELSAEEHRSLYIPVGIAHGFQSLIDGSEVHYQISQPHAPHAARGVRWDDPAFQIDWPPAPPGGRVISGRDRSHPDFVA